MLITSWVSESHVMVIQFVGQFFTYMISQLQFCNQQVILVVVISSPSIQIQTCIKFLCALLCIAKFEKENFRSG